MQQAEGEFESLRNNVPLALYRISTNGKLLYANPAYLEMFGYHSFDEALNIPIADHYVRPEERESLIEQLIENKIVKDFENRM